MGPVNCQLSTVNRQPFLPGVLMKEKKEILISEQVLQVPFCYSAGEVTSRFLTGLRDEFTIYGIRCPDCRKVCVPPRSVCGSCFTSTTDWVPLNGKGVVESFTEVHYPETVHPVEAPFIIGVIRLEGADTAMTHLIRGIREPELQIGQHVQAVFADPRLGRILDISHFEPINT